MHYYGVEQSGDSLSHHGILGMKWGVRRFQNKDGTLTPAGKERYSIGELHGKPGLRRPGETIRKYSERVYNTKGNGKELVPYYKKWEDSKDAIAKYHNKFLDEHPYGSDKFKKLLNKAEKDYITDDYDDYELYELLCMDFEDTAKKHGAKSAQVMELTSEFLWPTFSKNDPESKRLEENTHKAYDTYSKKADELALASYKRVGSKPIRNLFKSKERPYNLATTEFTEATAKIQIAAMYKKEAEKQYYEEMKKKAGE